MSRPSRRVHFFMAERSQGRPIARARRRRPAPARTLRDGGARPWVVTLLPVFVAAALIVAALTPVVRSAARRVPLARLGGAGIGVAWIAVLAAVYAAGPDALRLPLRQAPPPQNVAAGFVVVPLGVRGG